MKYKSFCLCYYLLDLQIMKMEEMVFNHANQPELKWMRRDLKEAQDAQDLISKLREEALREELMNK